MSNVKINGTLLEYAEYGQGEPLVLVHGSASDYRTWYNQQEEFARRYRVITYSRRYHWPNEQIAENADYSMPEHLEDLQSLIQELGAVPAHLVGHSYGAFLCLLLAIKKPDLVRTLVLAEPPVITLFVSNTPKPLELLKLLVTRPRTALTLITFGAKAMAPAKATAERGDAKKAMRLFGATILGQQFYSQLSEHRLEQVDANATRAEFLGSGFAPLEAEQLHNVHTPILLITGRHSHSLFHRLADRLEELLPNVERIEIDGASHILHEDNALAFNQAVERFLERNREAA
jgi:pimeloyl-ACP methyl ester carboxylesterase